MKKTINVVLAGAASLFAVVACSDWTTPEANNYEPEGVEGAIHGEDYYENLRAWKASRTYDEKGVANRPVSFMWFSDWSPSGANMNTQMMGIPDSVDFISLWGNWKNLTEEGKADLKKMQTIKGTKVLLCFIVDNIGAQITPYKMTADNKYEINGKIFEEEKDAVAEFWGWYGGHPDSKYDDPAKMEGAIRKYARAIVDTVAKYGYNGFDYDLEPSYGHGGNIASYADRNQIFLDELSKYFGPKSGTGNLLCVDGEPHKLTSACGEMLDYFLLQAYNDGSYSEIDWRIEQLFKTFGGVLPKSKIVGMTVLNSNFESYGTTGGPDFSPRTGEPTFQLKGYAQFTYPVEGKDIRIGGIGAFRPVFDKKYVKYREAMRALHSPLPDAEGEKPSEN